MRIRRESKSISHLMYPKLGIGKIYMGAGHYTEEEREREHEKEKKGRAKTFRS